jgi:hypothetical protein
MKVYIGPYIRWIGPYQIAQKIFFWVDHRGVFADKPDDYERWDYKACEKLGDWLADTWVNNFCNWLHSKCKRNIKVRIDPYDTWSMDHTLAYIIHPMLIQLKNSHAGSNWVDDEDVPENIRSTSAPKLSEEDKNYGMSDKFIHDRWDWVLDELIWTFENIKNDDEEEFFKDGKYDFDARKIFDDRVRYGLRLFGKYYQGLWD